MGDPIICTCTAVETCPRCRAADDADDKFLEAVLDRPPSVLEEAARLVDGDRQDAYGHPSQNHACTAAMWNAYLNRRRSATGNPDYQMDGYDVCLLNDLQKTSRLANTRTRDSLVDKAGFVRNAELC